MEPYDLHILVCRLLALQVAKRRVAVKKVIIKKETGLCMEYDSRISLQFESNCFLQIKETFRSIPDAKRILRELRLLRHLGGHENVRYGYQIIVDPF